MNSQELYQWRNQQTYRRDPLADYDVPDGPEGEWTPDDDENYLKAIQAVEDAEVWEPVSIRIDARPFLRWLWDGAKEAAARCWQDRKFWLSLLVVALCWLLASANDSNLLDWLWRTR